MNKSSRCEDAYAGGDHEQAEDEQVEGVTVWTTKRPADSDDAAGKYDEAA